MISFARKTLLIPAILLGLSIPSAGVAAFKCWTNKQGVRECGNAVPPEYSQQRTTTKNDRGLTVNVQDRAKTKEEKEKEATAREEEEKRLAEEKRRQEEQAKKDRVLLATFTTEQDIINSRDRKLGAIEGIIEVTEASAAKLEEKLALDQKRAADLERGGKEVPADLTGDIETKERQIARKHAYAAAKRAEQEELKRRYEADLIRFRELKGTEQQQP